MGWKNSFVYGEKKIQCINQIFIERFPNNLNEFKRNVGYCFSNKIIQ